MIRSRLRLVRERRGHRLRRTGRPASAEEGRAQRARLDHRVAVLERELRDADLLRRREGPQVEVARQLLLELHEGRRARSPQFGSTPVSDAIVLLISVEVAQALLRQRGRRTPRPAAPAAGRDRSDPRSCRATRSRSRRRRRSAPRSFGTIEHWRESSWRGSVHERVDAAEAPGPRPATTPFTATRRFATRKPVGVRAHEGRLAEQVAVRRRTR